MTNGKVTCGECKHARITSDGKIWCAIWEEIRSPGSSCPEAEAV